MLREKEPVAASAQTEPLNLGPPTPVHCWQHKYIDFSMVSCLQTKTQTRVAGDRGEGPDSAGPGRGPAFVTRGEAAAAGPGPRGGARARVSAGAPSPPVSQAGLRLTPSRL